VQQLLPNGDLSWPGELSFGSLPSAAAAAAAAGLPGKQQLPLHGSSVSLNALAGHSGVPGLTAAGGSIASGSIAGSGPPSTSAASGNALSYIQAHAESSLRSQANLKLLQQHIDELTTEKLELLRGLQQQARANEALAEENRSLGEQHNQMASQLQAEQAAVKRLEQEVEAVAASMAALVGERDAHRAAATEASERANVSVGGVILLTCGLHQC
jgi:FtsZ-binding cell division protein ZapB